MSTPSLSPKCRNCGHDRQDHEVDDGCWHEVETEGRGRLCNCRKFEPDSRPPEKQPKSTKAKRQIIEDWALTATVPGSRLGNLSTCRDLRKLEIKDA